MDVQSPFDWLLAPFANPVPVLGIIPPAPLMLAAFTYFTFLFAYRNFTGKPNAMLSAVPPFYYFGSWWALQLEVFYLATAIFATVLGIGALIFSVIDRFFTLNYPRGINRTRANMRFSHGILAAGVFVSIAFTLLLAAEPTRSCLIATNISWTLVGVASIGVLVDGIVLSYHYLRMRRAAA